MQSQFTTTRQFTLPLQGQMVQVEAMIAFCAYQITRATGPNGLPFDVTLDDLEVFESFVEAQITTTETRAFNMETRRMEVFSVTSWGPDILAIASADGVAVPRHTPTFTEVAESFLIDRQYNEAVESDQPHAAALAGYLHPLPVAVKPFPSSAGHGYRRAA